MAQCSQVFESSTRSAGHLPVAERLACCLLLSSRSSGDQTSACNMAQVCEGVQAAGKGGRPQEPALRGQHGGRRAPNAALWRSLHVPRRLQDQHRQAAPALRGKLTAISCFHPAPNNSTKCHSAEVHATFQRCSLQLGSPTASKPNL